MSKSHERLEAVAKIKDLIGQMTTVQIRWAIKQIEARQVSIDTEIERNYLKYFKP